MKIIMANNAIHAQRLADIAHSLHLRTFTSLGITTVATAWSKAYKILPFTGKFCIIAPEHYEINGTPITDILLTVEPNDILDDLGVRPGGFPSPDVSGSKTNRQWLLHMASGLGTAASEAVLSENQDLKEIR